MDERWKLELLFDESHCYYELAQMQIQSQQILLSVLAK